MICWFVVWVEVTNVTEWTVTEWFEGTGCWVSITWTGLMSITWTYFVVLSTTTVLIYYVPVVDVDWT